MRNLRIALLLVVLAGCSTQKPTPAKKPVPMMPPAPPGLKMGKTSLAVPADLSPHRAPLLLPGQFGLTIVLQPAAIQIAWQGETGPFQLEESILIPPTWQSVGGPTMARALTTQPSGSRFYRVRAQIPLLTITSNKLVWSVPGLAMPTDSIDHFTVERSANNQDWTMLNANLPGSAREFTDTTVPNPTFWYRLTGYSVNGAVIPYNVVSINIPANPPGTAVWARGAITDNAGGQFYGVTSDSGGNVYGVGLFAHKVNFGDGSVSAVLLNDAFIVKYSPGGTILWKKMLGGVGNDSVLGCTIDNHDNLIVCGNFGGIQTPDASVDFGNGPVVADSTYGNGFVAKYTPAGTLAWVQHYHSISFVGSVTLGGKSIAVDASDNLYVVAQCIYGADFGGLPGGGFPLGTPTGGAADVDMALAKLDGSTGATVWAVRYGGANNEAPKGIALDKNGDLIVIGSIQGSGVSGTTTDLGGGSIHVTAGNFAAFVAKYHSSNGGFVWQRLYGLSGQNQAVCVSTDPLTGNIVVAGQSTNPINFGNGNVGVNGGVFILGLDSSGSRLWEKFTGLNGNDTAIAIEIRNGIMAVTGRAQNSIYFGGSSSLLGNGQVNGWVAGFTISGNAAPVNTWTRYYGAGVDGASAAYCVNIDVSGHVLVGGGFLSNEDFGGPPPDSSPSLPMTAGTAGYSSGFLAKYY